MPKIGRNKNVVVVLSFCASVKNEVLALALNIGRVLIG